MNFTEYTIFYKKLEVEDTYVFRMKPKNPSSVFAFQAGQYCFLKNPNFSILHEEHPFSIASSPIEKNYLEFCIKVYGDWTQAFSHLEVNAPVEISQPIGQFTWDMTISHAVFLLGGIGISPLISILRCLNDTKQQPCITMIYGNRTPETIAYNDELESLKQKLKYLNIIHIFSHITNDHPWKGYRGFVTSAVLVNEVDFSKSPTFFVVGPPIFIEKMITLLRQFHIHEGKIKIEILEKK